MSSIGEPREGGEGGRRGREYRLVADATFHREMSWLKAATAVLDELPNMP